MSFNNHLAFNVSKSTPTTSTTNTNLMSQPNTMSDINKSDASGSENGSSAELNSTASVNRSQFIHGMLLKSSTDRDSPKFISSPVLSEAAPTVVTYGDDNVSTNASGLAQPSSNRKELIGLFDKFDLLDKKDTDGDEEVEDKFDRYKRLKEAKEAADDSTIERNVDADSVAEVIEEKHLDSSNSSPRDYKAHSYMSPSGSSSHNDKRNELEPAPEEQLEEEPKQAENIPEAALEKLEEHEAPTEPEPAPVDPNSDSLAKPESDNLVEIEEDENVAVEKYQLTQEEINQHRSAHHGDNINVLQRPDVGSRSISQVNINPADRYEQSHKPFDFHIFLEQLKKKSADPIVRYIRSFLVSFNKQSRTFTMQQKSKIVRDFKIFMHEKFILFEPFASMDETDLENSREGLEKLIMNRIYVLCFPPELIKNPGNNQGLVAKDIQEDKYFAKQLDKFSWVNGKHLDVDLDNLTKLEARANEEDLDFMQFAIKEFKKINDYRAPRDKIICILNACKIIFGFLKVNNQETNADAFIPILILIIIKAKIDNLISNIHYIENFRGPEWLNHGETSYYLSSIQGAINFIDNLSFDDLSIEQEEYDAHMEAWEADERIRKEKAKTENIPIQQPRPHPGIQDGTALSPSSVLMTSAEMFTKSISNFLSPSPQGTPPAEEGVPQRQTPSGQNEEAERISETYSNLKEIFPNLDKAILKDIVYMNKGDMDSSLDGCLQLVSE